MIQRELGPTYCQMKATIYSKGIIVLRERQVFYVKTQNINQKLYDEIVLGKIIFQNDRLKITKQNIHTLKIIK